MSALELLKRWLDLLAAAAIGWRDAARARATTTVTAEGGELVLRAAAGAALASVPLGTRLPDAVLGTVSRSFVVLELPPDRVVSRRLGVPAQARTFLTGVVQNQIERLSPWKVDQAVYGFAAEDAADAPGSLTVRILIASRSAMDAARQLAGQAGLDVDRIVARDAGEPALDPVPLWSRTANASSATLRRARFAAGLAVLALVGASAGVSTWAMMSASAASAKSEALGARIKMLQGQALATKGAPGVGPATAPERVWAWKEGAPAVVVVLEAVSAALPETAYLTEFTLQGATLRLVGQASDAPALIGPLEASGHLADVRFFAPTTRAADGARFRFHIEARVLPRLEVAR